MARVRIRDVADAADVSITTVSLVLNNSDARIPEKTRERVRAAAEALGYAPNQVARGLREKRTRTIGFISNQIATTPFAGRMILGVQDVAREHGYLIILVDTGGDEETEREAIASLANQRVDRMIYASMWHQVVDRPKALPQDAVFLNCRPADEKGVAVVPDDRAGGRLATERLLTAGHRRIAYLDAVSEPHPIATDLRYEGYCDALRQAGIEPEPRLRVSAEVSAQGGREATNRLFDLPSAECPTAVFCFNDRVAAGVYQAAHRRGLLLPGDLSIVGYDDQQYVAAEQEPPLTTIALPHYAMGRWAMEQVLGVAPAWPAGPAHLMECPLVERESVGPPSEA
ncbi:MAG: LacI family DNA-binding transcriptional regulator [Propionibacteriaceae bacterium]|jgi:LacI family transcriptional regulator|nr:LacI family DNA-binding transcriptional regulator [Propionibacteriaceae bacterium]